MNPNEIKKAKDFLRIAKEFEANATIDRETVVVISDYINQLEAKVETAKSDAIKEFAERLKGNFAGGWLEIEEDWFEKFVKEMVGDEE